MSANNTKSSLYMSKYIIMPVKYGKGVEVWANWIVELVAYCDWGLSQPPYLSSSSWGKSKW